MLYINESTNEIQLTRGDTAYLSVPLVIVTDNGCREYEMSAVDELVITVREKDSSPDIIIQKKSVGHNEFKIEPEDTKALECTHYRYDIQLNKSNGDVFTVIPPSYFRILTEVTY